MNSLLSSSGRVCASSSSQEVPKRNGLLTYRLSEPSRSGSAGPSLLYGGDCRLLNLLNESTPSELVVFEVKVRCLVPSKQTFVFLQFQPSSQVHPSACPGFPRLCPPFSFFPPLSIPSLDDNTSKKGSCLICPWFFVSSPILALSRPLACLDSFWTGVTAQNLRRGCHGKRQDSDLELKTPSRSFCFVPSAFCF